MTTMLERLSATMADLLREDPGRVLLGEDVTDGGVIGLSRAASADDALAPRLVATPLSTSAALSHAGGLALGGMRPIVLPPSASTLVEALPALRELGRLRSRTRGDAQTPVPVLVVAPTGPGFGLGGDWAASPESLLARLPGLRVVIAGDANGLDGLLRSAADFAAGPDPTVLLLPRELLLRHIEGEPSTATTRLDEARIVAEGDAATVFAWGSTVERARDAAYQAQQTLDRSIHVVDVQSLSPLDEATLFEAARHTGKIVIAHAGAAAMGLGGELAALFADQAILHLDAPVLRVGGSPEPNADDASAVPTVAAITDAILTVATY